MKIENVSVSLIETNKGQIDGLPKNPRFIRDKRLELLKKSIQENPEMLELRELIVVPFNGKYIVIGGNMRLRACKELGMTEVPCKILPEDTPVRFLREVTIKDNNQFGAIDWDIIMNEFDSNELFEWGFETALDDSTEIDDNFFETEEKSVENEENAEKNASIKVMLNNKLADKYEEILETVKNVIDKYPGCEIL